MFETLLLTPVFFRSIVTVVVLFIFMLDIQFIRDNPDAVKEGIAKKNADPKLVDRFLRLDEEWKVKTNSLNELLAEKNKLDKKLAYSRTEDFMHKAQVMKKRIDELEGEVRELSKRRMNAVYLIPNLPLPDVPVGKEESENVVVKSWGEPIKFDFKPKDHMELGKKLRLIDTEKAAEVVGSRFYYLFGDAVLLEYALVQFAFSVLMNEKLLSEIARNAGLDIDTKAFVPVSLPTMIKPDVYIRTARLDPGLEIERFHLERDDFYLVGSAEHTLVPLHMDEILKGADLPIRYVGHSSSFRRESGSYGRDTKGILRVHEFHKIEMLTFTTKDKGLREQDFIVAIQEYFMQQLELPYQVISICTGDMGAPDVRQIDINTWMSGQGTYKETHTSDYNADYQARRLATKVKVDGKGEFVHTNDATVFAIGRVLIAILENYQTKEGTVRVPKVLQKYLGKEEIK